MAGHGIMAGKRGLIMGVANERSIAWGIAQSLAAQQAELAFTYQGDLFKKRVTPLVTPLKPVALIDCDVSQPASIDAAFAGHTDPQGRSRGRALGRSVRPRRR